MSRIHIFATYKNIDDPMLSYQRWGARNDVKICKNLFANTQIAESDNLYIYITYQIFRYIRIIKFEN